MPGNHRKWHDGGVWRSTCLFDSAWCNLTALAESDFVAIGNDETNTEWESAWPKDSRFGRSMSERLQQFGRRQGNEAHCSAFQEKVAACSCSILDPSASQCIPSSHFIPLHPTSSHFIPLHPTSFTRISLSLHRWWFKSSSLQLRWDHSMAIHVLRAAFHQETSRSWQSTCSFHPWFWQFFACAYAGYLSTAISRGFVARSRCMDSISKWVGGFSTSNAELDKTRSSCRALRQLLLWVLRQMPHSICSLYL